MSRVGNTPPPPPKPPTPQTANQANDGAFARKMGNRLQRKDDRGRKEQSQKTDDKDGGKKAAKKSPHAAILRQTQPATYSARKGTVADLQNQLALQGQDKDGKAGDLKNLDQQLMDNLGDNGLQNVDNSLAGAAGQGVDGLQQAGGQAVQGGSFDISDGKIPTGMMDKIVDSCRMGTTATGGTKLQFDLKGDVLGGLKMDITYDNGKLKATFMSENPEIRKLMDENLKTLERDLRDRGIVLEGLEVRDPKEQQRDQQNQQRQKERQEVIDGVDAV